MHDPHRARRPDDAPRPSSASVFLKIGCVGALAWQLPILITAIEGWAR